jgi:pimeloyl-ACP methyl ester carboxylesterase
VLARLQKLIVFVLIVASVAWATILTRLGHPGWALAIVLLILLGYALFLGLEFAALYFVQNAEPSGPRVGLWQLLQAWWGEVITAPRVFLWRQPFRSHADADYLPKEHSGHHGLVLVHGFVCNRGLWNPWIRHLRSRGIPHIAVNLEPLFGSIDSYPAIIDAAVARLEAATGETVVLVGHSMGGLAIRAWLREFDADARVRRVITIGSPHRGTWLARFGHTTNGKQMRQRSPWLTHLAAAEPPARVERFTCFYGHCDNIVFPVTSGTLPGAVNLHLPATAHVHMAFHPLVFSEAVRWTRMSAAVSDVPEAAAVATR